MQLHGRRMLVPVCAGYCCLILLLALLCACGSSSDEPPSSASSPSPTPEEEFSENRPPVHWTPLGEGANIPRLSRGFFDPDDPTWRWTEPTFHLYLDPIHTSEKNYVALDFAVAREHIEQAGKVTLTAFVDGERIGSSEYEAAGRREFSAEVPQSLIANKAHAQIEFRVEPPVKLGESGGELRGIIAVGAGFRDYHSTTELRALQKQRARNAYAELVKRQSQRIPAAERDRMQLLFHDLEVWRSMWFHGVEVIKNPLDLWMAQQVIYELQPDFIVETGTFKGGSALYWAHTLQGMRLTNSKVLTVDIYDHLTVALKNPLWDEYVQFFLGSSTDAEIVSKIATQVEDKTTIVFLDSDHRAHHVKRELEMYAPMVSPESYIVVEDTHIDALGTQPAIEAGPMAAIEEFLASEAGKDFERDLTREAFVLTFNPGGWLKRKAD